MVIAVASEEMIFHMDDTVITMKVLMENSALSAAGASIYKIQIQKQNTFFTLYIFFAGTWGIVLTYGGVQ